MNTALLPTARSRCDRALLPHSSLEVVAICEGLIGAVYAHEAVESLGQMLNSDTMVRSSYWKFDMLDGQDNHHPSLRLAANADLIVVSAFCDEPLPAHVCSWLMNVMRESNDTPPFLAAFHPGIDDGSILTSPMCEFLGAVASLWHTEFLCNDSFDHRLHVGLPTELLLRQAVKPRMHSSIHHRAAPANGFCWGIPA